MFAACPCAKGGHYSLAEGTLFTSEKCQGGQCSPVNNVGDIIHSDNGIGGIKWN